MNPGLSSIFSSAGRRFCKKPRRFVVQIKRRQPAPPPEATGKAWQGGAGCLRAPSHYTKPLTAREQRPEQAGV